LGSSELPAANIPKPPAQIVPAEETHFVPGVDEVYQADRLEIALIHPEHVKNAVRLLDLEK